MQVLNGSNAALSSTSTYFANVNPLRYRGYYYDTELGFYYLQSRYYDPSVGRFINADAAECFTMAAYGLADTNLFVYCRNNPVSYFDDCGELPAVLTDKIIHDQVLNFICKQYENLTWRDTCIQYLDEFKMPTGRWGFCDLYNIKTGEVWELKKNSDSASCLTVNAQAQLNRYIQNGRLKKRRDLTLRSPNQTVINPSRFTTCIGLYIYEVNYWYEGSGILRYDYTKTLNSEAVTQVATCAALGLCIGLCAWFCLAAIPGLLFV